MRHRHECPEVFQCALSVPMLVAQEITVMQVGFFGLRCILKGPKADWRTAEAPECLNLLTPCQPALAAPGAPAASGNLEDSHGTGEDFSLGPASSGKAGEQDAPPRD